MIARSSTSRYGNQAVDVRTVGQQLGARYVMEGGLRQAGASLRVAVRSKPIDQLSPYEALLRAFGYYERVTPEEHAVARPILE